MGGGVRIGRILEDMDIFAVHLVFKHVENPRQVFTIHHHHHHHNLHFCPYPQGPHLASPLSIVTAMVDSIDFTRPLR